MLNPDTHRHRSPHDVGHLEKEKSLIEKYIVYQSNQTLYMQEAVIGSRRETVCTMVQSNDVPGILKAMEKGKRSLWYAFYSWLFNLADPE